MGPADWSLDDERRIDELRNRIATKGSLRLWYEERYVNFKQVLLKVRAEGRVLEIGSGAGFLKEVIPEAETSDFLDYSGVDLVVDATNMPFKDETVRALFLLNTLHHVPDVEGFFRELVRCVKPGGRVLISDQYPGLWAAVIYRFLHHEAYDADSRQWSFESEGPLSGANGALCWIVFFRDLERFQRLFPELRVERRTRHSPLRYWLAGGLRSWGLLPKFAFPLATTIDRVLARVAPYTSSFVDVELVRD